MFVLVKLMGGIGSQMLQYATARCLALRHDCEVLLDLSFLNDKERTDITIRDFELDYFPVKARIATPDELAKSEAYQHSWPHRLINKARKLVGMRPAFAYIGEGGDFNDRTVALANFPTADLLFVEGYWFNEGYFLPCANDIRQDLAFQPFTDDRNKAVAHQIATTTAISLHVRRGDYLKYAAHGVCPPAYYERAIAYLAECVPDSPTYFVFSDDITWVRNNIPLPGTPVYIDWNKGAKSIEDVHLMHLCQHQIIANSSFSWWGGWLNTNPKKIVICPKLWHGDPVISSSRVVPPSWVQL
jgi:hypothetical protein